LRDQGGRAAGKLMPPQKKHPEGHKSDLLRTFCLGLAGLFTIIKINLVIHIYIYSFYNSSGVKHYGKRKAKEDRG
jgi:hypothetical protein